MWDDQLIEELEALAEENELDLRTRRLAMQPAPAGGWLLVALELGLEISQEAVVVFVRIFCSMFFMGMSMLHTVVMGKKPSKISQDAI